MILQAPNLWYNSCSSKLSEKRRQDFKKWGFLLRIFMQLIPLFYLTMKLFYWCFLLQYNEIDCLNCKLNFLFNFLLTAALKKNTSLFYLFLQKTTPSSFASFVYDAVWVYALALNTLLESDPIAVKHLHSDENTRLV